MGQRILTIITCILINAIKPQRIELESNQFPQRASPDNPNKYQELIHCLNDEYQVTNRKNAFLDTLQLVLP